MKTYTFYSYKGGTGRTLLLANTARYMALAGLNVVALDLDFEAPGLHYKLNISPPGQRIADAIPERGAVDFLLQLVDFDAPQPNLMDFVVPVPLPRDTAGKLYLMPAGASPSAAYWHAMTKLLRANLFADPSGLGIGAWLELKLRIEAELEADYLLIDSRTGMTELGGVTTSLLADTMVCLMLPNRESLGGSRAILRGLHRAIRPEGSAPIDFVPVLSRVPAHPENAVKEALAFLNEPAGSPEDTLHLEKLYVLRTDPELEGGERLHVGAPRTPTRSLLYQDYLVLLTDLVESEPGREAHAARRLQAVRDVREWLTRDRSDERHRRWAPDSFDDEHVDEGVTFQGNRWGRKESRYADLVAYGGEDRSEALVVVEYVDDLAASEAWKWWQDFTKLRCLVLVGPKEEGGFERRLFTRGRKKQNFQERDRWTTAVTWPISYSALEDPGDRSVPALLSAVQRGEDGFISLLVREWHHATAVTLHGGAPYRPRLARQILDGLAAVEDVDTAARILWRTAPDPFERRFDEERMMRMEGGGRSLEEQTTRELHFPLWCRVPVEAKIGREMDGPWGRLGLGIEQLACDLLGLSFDPDADFRREAGELVGPVDEGEDSPPGPYRLADLFYPRELRFELVTGPSPELVRREVLRQRLEAARNDRDRDDWAHAERSVARQLGDDRAFAALLRWPGGAFNVPVSFLLASYDPTTAELKLYSDVLDACARVLGLDRRSLANIAFLHETIHALCHLGRDLDGRRWEEFSLPNPRDPAYRPSAFHEAITQYFTYQQLVRLDDKKLLDTFEKLNEHQPPEYQAWRKMKDAPVESIRRLLMRARAGLDDTPWG